MGSLLFGLALFRCCGVTLSQEHAVCDSSGRAVVRPLLDVPDLELALESAVVHPGPFTPQISGDLANCDGEPCQQTTHEKIEYAPFDSLGLALQVPD